MRDIVRDLETGFSVAPLSRDSVPNIFPEPLPAAEIPPHEREAARRSVQRTPSGVPAPPTILSFDGGSALLSGGLTPPDTNGDVSPAHYIQWVNVRWSIYDKITGARIAGPTNGNSFWQGFGGPCENTNRGDPIALWDDRAERWIMSQFVVSDPGVQCFAISSTSDPLGTYFRYQFDLPRFGDYPHLGVWSDIQEAQNAYLLVTHDFSLVPEQFVGASFIALERDRMLKGLPAQLVRFSGLPAFGALPVHLEGTEPGAAALCPVFLHFDPQTSEYLLWDLCVKWSDPASSTISVQPERIAATKPFVTNLARVPQRESPATLQSFGGQLMYRATGRAFPEGAPTRMSIAVNHYVEGADNGNGGIKWVKFAVSPISQPEFPAEALFANGFEFDAARISGRRIDDEGTFAPDAHSRWLGAIAVDRSGNLGLGYSVSSARLNPELRITGREFHDPPGTLRDEQACIVGGTGSQLRSDGRWGDYASMSVDPVDECTFWFTSEYYAVTSTEDWNTRVCSFRFPACGSPTFDLVTESPTRFEVCGAPATPDPAIDLRVGVLNGFDDPVVLSTSGLPTRISPSFVPSIIDPTPGTSVLTLQGANRLRSGEYSGVVHASSGANVRTKPLSFGVSAALSAAPFLTTPLEGASGIKIRPTLAWSAEPNALEYKVDVATDAAFTTIVASETVTDTSWVVDISLNASTQYFWRVRPSNYCGNGTVSATRSFTTGIPGTCPTGTAATIAFQDTFENGLNGWVPAGTGPNPWALGTAPGGIGMSTNVWRVPNNALTSDQTLVSPNIVLPVGAAGVILSFDAYHSFEIDPPTGCWDGSAVEARQVGMVDWQYLSAGRIFTNGYNGSVTAGAPLAGREVWCYTPAGNTVQRTVVDLDSFVGQTIQLRFRATSDSNTVATPTTSNGMSIDNLRVDVCQ